MDGAHCGGPHARRTWLALALALALGSGLGLGLGLGLGRAVEGRGAQGHRREAEALYKVVEGDLDQVLLRQVLAAEAGLLFIHAALGPAPFARSGDLAVAIILGLGLGLGLALGLGEG